jgi:uncharacterized protein YggE
MAKKLQYISVFAICFSIVRAAAIISYKPFEKQQENDLFKFPTGIPTALGSVQSVAVGGNQINAILVTGSGSSSTKANQATVTLGVYTEDSSASEAVEDNAARMSAIINAIKALNIPEEKIKTVSYYVSPNYDWEYRRIVSYRVTNTIQVNIDDLNLIGRVIDEASKAGANDIQGISFGLTDEIAEELQDNAYVNALNDAKRKADLIAETLELQITGVLSVSESVYYPYMPFRGYAETATDTTAPTPILEGSLSVSVSVQVAFSFQ